MGSVTATALVATVDQAQVFKNEHQLATWLGLVPRQLSSGGPRRLDRITKRGDASLRTLLIHGTRVVMRQFAQRTDATSRWITALKTHRGSHTAVVALAAKHARMLWPCWRQGESINSSRAPEWTRPNAGSSP
ncbi:MAG: transposase [Nitrospiraceae bacterium]